MEEHIIFLTELVGKFKDFDHKKQFNLLIKTGCGRRETLHSNLIVDFLNFNPKYLELFLKEIDVPGFNDYPNTKIYRELPSNGFIDIYILNHNLNKAIIIENKVDDPGKYGQLQKYYDEIEKKYPNNVTAFYLTKYGNLPPKDDDCQLKECLSYEKHIVGWLEECIKYTTEPSNHRIKESLEIYVELVRDVIKRDKYMEKVFDYLKKNENSMSMAIDIYNTLNGRNFFEDIYIQDRVKGIFSTHLENTGLTNKWEPSGDGYQLDLSEEDDEGNIIGTFYLFPREIYADFSDNLPNQDKLVTGSHIVGNNLSDDRLKAILTNNTDVIHEYFDNCVSQMREKIFNYHGV